MREAGREDVPRGSSAPVPNARSERKVDPSGAGLEIHVSESDGNAERAAQLSGALSLLSPYRVRRAGVI